MYALIAYGSKMGGTAGIAELVGALFKEAGHDVDVRSGAEVDDVSRYDVVIVGGALYANWWHRDARRVVKRFSGELQGKPVWLFSSGPLDDTAAQADLPPVKQVQRFMERIGARGHVTFGGRLPADAKGFPASAMAKTHAGDWRDPEHIRRWTREVLSALEQTARAPREEARPGPAPPMQPGA